MKRVLLAVLALGAALSVSLPGAFARTEATQAPDAVPGITRNSIVIGGTFPLSGIASLYAPIPRGMEAYFNYINARRDKKTGQRGIYGRRIVWKYYDDGYNPAQTVQLTNKLILEDRVLRAQIINLVNNRRRINTQYTLHLEEPKNTTDGQGLHHPRHAAANLPRLFLPVVLQARPRAGMVAGEIDYTAAIGSAMRAAATGVPIKATMFSMDRVLIYMFAKATIKSIEELKGGKRTGSQDLYKDKKGS
jgi:hypothetical protein